MPAAAPAPPIAKEKPQLATFRLRRGKAYGGGKRPEKKPPPFEKLEKKTPPPFEKLDPKDRKHRDRPRRDDRKKREDRGDRPERVISAKPKTQEDSPFAVLQGIKLKAKDGQ
jgi:hypothetical protein